MTPLLLILGVIVEPVSELPPLGDLQRFPPAYVARDFCEFNRLHYDYAYSQFMRAQNGTLEEDWWRSTQYSCDRLHRSWLALKTAQEESRDEYARREALGSLRGFLGDEDYYAGWMPPHVPLWRFFERD